MSKQFHNQDEADNRHRELEARIKEANYRIEKLEKQVDPKEVELKLTRDISETHEKTEDAIRRLKLVEEQLDSMSSVMSSMGGGDGTSDPHKLCYLDGEIKRLKDTSRSHDTKIGVLDE